MGYHIFLPFPENTRLSILYMSLQISLLIVYTGFAFVTFMMPEHAVTAFSELDGSTFNGRLLHLLPAKPKEETEEGAGGPGSEFKKQKDAKLKASAGNSYNWNSLFLASSDRVCVCTA